MLPSFAKQTITRIRPGVKTSRGSTIPDWDNVDSLVIGGCSVQPGTTDLDGLTCYLPEGADVQEGDRIEYDGNVYTIDGSPRRWQGAFNLSHVQINLRRWKG